MGEEKKKGRFIYVTVDEPEQPQRKFTFFTDVPSASIVEGSTGLSDVYLLSEPRVVQILRRHRISLINNVIRIKRGR